MCTEKLHGYHTSDIPEILKTFYIHVFWVISQPNLYVFCLNKGQFKTLLIHTRYTFNKHIINALTMGNTVNCYLKKW